MNAPEPEARAELITLPQAPDAIELRHLRMFVAVAEELNFSRAAERLHLTQPALSRQVRSLERLLGVVLLRRSTRQVELTLAGEALLNRTRPMLADLDHTVALTRSAGGLHHERLARLTQPFMDKVLEGIEPFREAFEAMHARLPAADGISARPLVAGGVSSLVYEQRPGTAPTVMYIHGGGFLLGSAYGSSRPLASVLAATTQRSILVPDYRLAPEHPYPAGATDIATAYAWLTSGGTSAREIALVADSAGCAMLMTLMHHLKNSGGVMPGCIVLLSPWVDMGDHTLDATTDSDPESRSIRDQLNLCVPAYLAETPVDDPAVNSLHADLTGLPPMLIQAGAGDFLVPDAHQLLARAQAHGVDARLELYPVNSHFFHMFWSFLPEAAKALGHAGTFIAARSSADVHQTRQSDTA